MAKAKAKKEDLKGKTKDELIKALLETRKEQFNLRFQRTGGTLENTSEIRKARRAVARIKTQLSTQRNAEAQASKTGAAKAKPVKTTPKAKAAKPAAKAKKTAA
jgi:large subunit ribosomal protein L29